MHGPPYAKLYYSLIRDARISASEKVVMLVLQKWGWKHHECYMAASSVAEHSGLSERTVKYSLKHLQELGFIKRVPDKSKRTGRKYLLLWLDDPTYLPPHKSPKDKPRRSAKPKAEKVCNSTRDQIEEAARSEVSQLAREGWSEEAVYDKLAESIRGANLSDEQFDWHHDAWIEAIESAFPGSPCPEGLPWKPGDPGQPNRSQVARWASIRLGEIIAADPEVDQPEGDLFAELTAKGCGHDIWKWCEEAVEELSPRPMSEIGSPSPGP